MTKSRLRISLTAATLLLTVLACAVPGLPTASAPAPTVDTVRLATMVAETVSAALQLTVSAATSTSTPAPTSTSLPPTPTETATGETPASESTLTMQSDGSTNFVDHRGGYEVTVPSGWLAVRVDQEEYFNAWTLAVTANPPIQRALLSIENQDPDTFRLFALDTQDGHVQGGFVTNINFLLNEQEHMSLADETDLLAASQALPATIPGLEVLTTELTRTAGDVPIGVITSRWTTQTADGVDVVVFQKQVFLELKVGTLTITLSMNEGLHDVVLPSFDALINSLKVTE